ncbi:hypothetical protein K438DRAFT_1981636 [Mycena galopus ATCC 62051]|nr:hypothetical protein K438DRAFT_1981636 [Mycena galopus ATCC 62051]
MDPITPVADDLYRVLGAARNLARLSIQVVDAYGPWAIHHPPLLPALHELHLSPSQNEMFSSLFCLVDAPHLNAFHTMFHDGTDVEIVVDCGDVLKSVVALSIDGFVCSIATIQNFDALVANLEVLDLARCTHTFLTVATPSGRAP